MSMSEAQFQLKGRCYLMNRCRLHHYIKQRRQMQHCYHNVFCELLHFALIYVFDYHCNVSECRLRVNAGVKGALD